MSNKITITDTKNTVTITPTDGTNVDTSVVATPVTVTQGSINKVEVFNTAQLGKNIVTHHITASGNISASGDITASQMLLERSGSVILTLNSTQNGQSSRINLREDDNQFGAYMDYDSSDFHIGSINGGVDTNSINIARGGDVTFNKNVNIGLNSKLTVDLDNDTTNASFAIVDENKSTDVFSISGDGSGNPIANLVLTGSVNIVPSASVGGNITASGNISASGDIIANNFSGSGIFISGSGGVTIIGNRSTSGSIKLLDNDTTASVELTIDKSSAYANVPELSGLIAGRGNEGAKTGYLGWNNKIGGSQSYYLGSRNGGFFQAGGETKFTIYENCIKAQNVDRFEIVPPIVASSHITASGIISSSNDIKGRTLFTDYGLFLRNSNLNDLAIQNETAGTGYIRFLTKEGGTEVIRERMRIQNSGTITMGSYGSTNTRLNIFGTVSASGDIITTDITSSGNISASGTIIANNNVGTYNNFILFNEYGSTLYGLSLPNYNTVRVGGFNNGKVEIAKHTTDGAGGVIATFNADYSLNVSSSISAGNHITASGNISASGDINAANFISDPTLKKANFGEAFIKSANAPAQLHLGLGNSSTAIISTRRNQLDLSVGSDSEGDNGTRAFKINNTVIGGGAFITGNSSFMGTKALKMFLDNTTISNTYLGVTRPQQSNYFATNTHKLIGPSNRDYESADSASLGTAMYFTSGTASYPGLLLSGSGDIHVLSGSIVLDYDKIPTSDPGVKGTIYRSSSAGIDNLLFISPGS